MAKFSVYFLRIGLGITFAWIGILILNNPAGWGTYLQPWAVRLLPVPLEQAMIATGILDVAIGAMLLFGIWTWLAALVGALHIVTVIITVGINEMTVRDIGLLAASLALAVQMLPARISSKLSLGRTY